MFFLEIFMYTLVLLFFIADCYLILKFIEYLYCTYILKQPPMVSSANVLRKEVLRQITTHYKNAKTICDFGSGFGGLTRLIAKNTNAAVYGLENMPFSVFISKLLDLFYKTNNKTIWCNAFEYMKTTTMKFDVVIAYLGPDTTKKLLKYKNKMHVLILLDFDIKGKKPTRIIDIGYGSTIYHGKFYPHKLFIYEFK